MQTHFRSLFSSSSCQSFLCPPVYLCMKVRELTGGVRCRDSAGQLSINQIVCRNQNEISRREFAVSCLRLSFLSVHDVFPRQYCLGFHRVRCTIQRGSEMLAISKMMPPQNLCSVNKLQEKCQAQPKFCWFHATLHL